MADKDYGPRVGADPELFVQTIEEGQVVPICGKIGGTKENPIIINKLVDAIYGAEIGRRNRDGKDSLGREGDYAVQEDNVMLEFNVPAYKSGAAFVDSISKVLNTLDSSVLSQHGLKCKHDVMHTFKPEDLVPYPQAFTVGCLADMNAYAENDAFERTPFTAAHFGNHRFCGGHIHVQYNYNNVPKHVFAQFMDLVAELPFIRWDKQKMRRMFYGQPGIYREKPYGIEYRTLSNFWLGQTFREKYLPLLSDNVFILAQTANNDPERLKSAYSKIDWDDVQHAIKTEDHKLAVDIVDFARGKCGISMSGCASR
jgi:Phage phiEco32-like COOH.NH2 ligase-type 2